MRKVNVEEYNKEIDKVTSRGLPVEETLIEMLEVAGQMKIVDKPFRKSVKNNTYQKQNKNFIPNRKINGERFGQLVFNALYADYDDKNDNDICTKLFYIENKELEKLINNYLEEK